MEKNLKEKELLKVTGGGARSADGQLKGTTKIPCKQKKTKDECKAIDGCSWSLSDKCNEVTILE